MHLRHLLIRDCKLMRRLEASFVRPDGSPRMWTVFVGENGTCKTTLLRTIALAGAGSAFANALIGESMAYLDRRGIVDTAMVDARFGFGSTCHDAREYPELSVRPAPPPQVSAWSDIGPTVVTSRSAYGIWRRDNSHEFPSLDARSYPGEMPTLYDTSIDASHVGAKAVAERRMPASPIDEVRKNDSPHWFLAAYGTGRMLLKPQAGLEGDVPKRDRMKSLFDPRHLPLGTGFSDRFAQMYDDDRARAFAVRLREALVDRMATPRLDHIELRGKGGARSHATLIESHRFAMRVGRGEVKLPAVWLSQGYQAVVSLVADIIGHVWLEAGVQVELDDMEGIVLVDELDLHLHPTWQTTIVRGLKAAFPRMQFIVTTHSPLVLAGCRADEVWTLTQDDATGDVTARQGTESPMLMTGSELNDAYFGVSQASPLSETLRRYVELASNPTRSDADDTRMTELLRNLHDNDIPVDYHPVARKSAS